MKNGIVIALLLLLTAPPAGAWMVDDGKNEVRVGWGDPLFETLVFHNDVHYVYQGLPETMTYTERNGYRYTGHFFGEYHRRLTRFWSVGVKLDWEMVSWNVNSYRGGSEAPVASKGECFCNFCVVPGVRMNWFVRRHFGMYSQIGAGINLNSGSQTDHLGRRKIVFPAFDLCFAGFRYDLGRWFAAAEFGGLVSLRDKQEVSMVLSRMFSISAGFKF